MRALRQTTAYGLRLIVMMSLIALPGLQHGRVNSANTACVQSTCIALPFVSVPQPLAVSGQYGFGDRMGNSHLQGQVVNQSNFPIASARVRISGVNALGIIMSQTVPLAFPVSLPGQINPFEWLLGSNGPNHPQFEVIGGSITSTQFVSVTVVTSRALSANTFEITFRNDRSVPLKNVQAVFGVVYTFTDFVSYDKVYPPFAIAEHLSPGMTLTHTFYINDIVYSPPNTPDRWVVAAQGTLDP